MKNEFLSALKVFTFLTVLFGVFYPAVITGVAQVIFPKQANGSLIYKNGKVVGSELIGQEFKGAELFHSRPSVTSYSTLPSSGSNAGSTSQDLANAIQTRKSRGDDFDLLYASASGLDPHISPEAAKLQTGRIAREGNMKTETLEQLVQKHIEPRTFGFLGSPRVNVLLLNLELRDLLEASPNKR